MEFWIEKKQLCINFCRKVGCRDETKGNGNFVEIGRGTKTMQKFKIISRMKIEKNVAHYHSGIILDGWCIRFWILNIILNFV